MKKVILFLFASAIVLTSCQKIADPDNLYKLSIIGVEDTIIVNFNTEVSYLPYPSAHFTLSKQEAGEVDVIGNFTSGTTEGTFTLYAVNTKNERDTVKKTIIVTKHADVFNNMKLVGNYLLSFRHANANNGTDQTTNTSQGWWKSCDASKARQITDPIGYKQTDSTGKVMKMMKLIFDTTMSSEFCRCKQTIDYFNLGVPNKEYADLTYYVYGEADRYANTMKLYAKKAMNTKNYLAVTHAGYTNTPTVAPLNSLNLGDCAVFKLNPNGAQPTYEKTIPLEDWLILARK